MPEHKYFGNLIWCDISISVDTGKELFVTLLNMHWEINWFIDWFIDSYPIFSKLEIELPKLKRESLAEVEARYNGYIKLLYDFEIDDTREFTIDEEEKADLEGDCIVYINDKFGNERSICEAFTLSNCPDFKIGLNNGIGEISYFDEDRKMAWKYNFDMEVFVRETMFEIRNALLIAKKDFFNPNIANRYDEFLSKINDHTVLNGYENLT
jgi:hypothetical protein